ncbi:hypothetical protein GYMLUDRAFT_43956 [Collybiopsis luxurians FD-317 M1]|uniref:Fungal-type protein kinase domain-containing protein n=1 Tax=Collybiopsis luxurians FD-317 M1 TaxID=944289 RepID=A0A0D0CNC1_9AGAR|nr:hypothetical protein GYMLUDRAFT_43956 [Collybiopsis luxurians FD-317 M1]
MDLNSRYDENDDCGDCKSGIAVKSLFKYSFNNTTRNLEHEIIKACLEVDKAGPSCSSSGQQAGFCVVPFGRGSTQTDRYEKWVPFLNGRPHGVLRAVIPGALQSIDSLKIDMQLAQVIYDMFQGHEWLYEKAGILHGDINMINALVRWEDSDTVCGVLHDFDRSTVTDQIILTQISTIIGQMDPNRTSSVMVEFSKLLSKKALRTPGTGHAS